MLRRVNMFRPGWIGSGRVSQGFPRPLFDYRFPALPFLPSGLTYTRPSQAFDYGLNAYANDVPRLAALGLLYEEAWTNKVLQSVDPVNQLSGGVAAPFTSNVSDPFGGTDASRISFDVDGSQKLARLEMDSKPTGDVKAYFWARINASSGAFTLRVDVSGGAFEFVTGQLDGGNWVRIVSGALPPGAAPGAFFDIESLVAGTTLDLDIFQPQAEETDGPSGSPIVTAGAAVTRAKGTLNIGLINGAYDILIERADLDGVVTKAFVDVTVVGGAGYDAPIDMTKPYISRIRPWPDGRLSAGHKAVLTA